MDTLFFAASKAAWALLRPESLILLLLAAALLASLRRRHALARWTLGTALAAALAVALLPLGDLLLRPLESRFPPAPPLGEVAGILVLGGSEDPDSSLAWGAPQLDDAGDRILAAAALARRHPEAVVLVTGGGARLRPSGTGEGGIAALALLDLGVARDRLLVEDRSRNTAENAALSLALAPDRGTGTWVLVTSAFHMPRAMATFCAAGWTGLVAWPTDFRSGGLSSGPRWDFAGHLGDLNLAAKEWVGLLAYRLTGRAAAC